MSSDFSIEYLSSSEKIEGFKQLILNMKVPTSDSRVEIAT
jgi:hypothetical protein